MSSSFNIMASPNFRPVNAADESLHPDPEFDEMVRLAACSAQPDPSTSMDVDDLGGPRSAEQHSPSLGVYDGANSSLYEGLAEYEY